MKRRTTRRDFLSNLAASAAALAAGTRMAAAQPETRPNFVVILCDDLGYGDIGCFGSEKHRTPNVDQMAREGIRLTSYYVTSGVCTPSRSSLMTGCYPRRVNMEQDANGGWVLFPIGAKGLNPNEETMAEVLKRKGYATACVGKWHLGDQPEFLPTRQGFDQYFGIPYSNDMGGRGGNDKRPPLPLMRDEKVVEAPADQNTLTQRYTQEAIAFIEAHRDGPFFLYLPHAMPHNPVHASAAFAGKSANGGYGDAVEEIDWSTGEILGTLERLGLSGNTLVVFTSDNGAASAWGGSNAPLSGFKGTTQEGGMRVSFVAKWPGKIPAGKESDAMVISMDLLPTFAGLAGADLPQDRRIDGLDIWPILSSAPGAESPHEAFYFYFMDQLQAVRSGKWKLFVEREEHPKRVGKEKDGTPKTPTHYPARLYDLEADVTEEYDVIDAHPEVARRLMEFADAARADLGDVGRPGAHQRPAGWVENPTPRVMEP